MRLRLPELLNDRELTAYQLAARSSGRISMSAAYRLTRDRGDFRCLSPAVLDALCDVLEVEPGDLFAKEPAKKGKR